MKNVRSLLAPAIVSVALFSISCSDEPTSVPSTPQNAGKNGGQIVAAPPGFAKVPDHYIVVFNDNVDQGYVDGEVERLRSQYDLTVSTVYSESIKGFAGFIPPGQLKKLAGEFTIERIEEDFEITLNPVDEKARPGSGGGGTVGQAVPWGVTRVGGPFNGAGKFAWIIDTGIDPNHRDLLVDGGRSANFVTSGKLSSPAWSDGNGHGTHVAGTIAALNNTVDVVGVAAGATVIAVRVLDNRGSGLYSWIIAGVEHVARNAQPGDVANMSLGGGFYATLNQAVINTATNAQVKFALAAGNEARDCSATSPASANGQGIYTVSAHDNGDVFATFSNFGAPVDISAPGVTVLSTKRGGGTTSMSGTSMAAPHVAGILLVGNVGARGVVIGDKDAWPDGLATRVP
jgi:subtilisin family serine protease